MNIPQFGAISLSDIKPGNAIVSNGFDKNIIYVVTEVTGVPQVREATRGIGYGKRGYGKTPEKTYIIPSGTFLPYTADRYQLQQDGSYKKTGEINSPVGLSEWADNPYHDVVQVNIDGDRLTLEA